MALKGSGIRCKALGLLGNESIGVTAVRCMVIRAVWRKASDNQAIGGSALEKLGLQQLCNWVRIRVGRHKAIGQSNNREVGVRTVRVRHKTMG